MIFADNLCKYYDTFLAVDGISINVQPGQVLALLGPNGAGKTTTVRMLSSVLRPSGGTARVAGFDVVRDAAEVRARVGVLTEQHGLYSRMNAIEYLEFFGRMYGMDWKTIQERSNTLLEAFGLAGVRKQRLGQYSKGMRQKLALTRALLHNPPVLLLDEPTSAMDPESAHAVRDAIRTQRSNDRSIILCTHNLSEAQDLSDQVAVIRHGRIIYNGNKENMMRSLLGPPQYQARFAGSMNGWLPQLPDGVTINAKGEDFLTFTVENPVESNPGLLRQLLEHGLNVISFQEMTRNLEQAYLAAMDRESLEEASHV
jgi:ABC-2 type transport system ATP-binding protein